MSSLSQRRILPGLLALVALLTLAACGGPTKPASLTGAQILEKANAHKPKSGEYAMTGVIDQGSQDIDVKGTGKFITDPGQSSLTVAFTTGGANATIDVVADEDNVFVRESASGIWRQDPVGSFEENSPVNYEITNPVLKGTEKLQGVEAYHLTGKNNEGGPVDFWFRTDTFYPVQSQIDSLGSGNFKDVTITFANLDSAVTIDVPSAN